MLERLNADVAGGVAVAGEGDLIDVRGEGVGAHAFGPLDDDDGAFVGEEFVQVDGVRGAGAFVESVEIEMVELKTPGVGIHESERGAGDIFFVDSQRCTDAFDEDRFAGAEWTAQ